MNATYEVRSQHSSDLHNSNMVIQLLQSNGVKCNENVIWVSVLRLITTHC